MRYRKIFRKSYNEILDAQFMLNGSLDNRLRVEAKISQSLEAGIPLVAWNNSRLAGESQAASQQLKRFTHWLFLNKIDWSDFDEPFINIDNPFSNLLRFYFHFCHRRNHHKYNAPHVNSVHNSKFVFVFPRSRHHSLTFYKFRTLSPKHNLYKMSIFLYYCSYFPNTIHISHLRNKMITVASKYH